jgi:hypothetical protein
MKNPARSVFCYSLLLFCSFVNSNALAHNGKTAAAYPVKNIKIDGDLSDWGAAKRHPLLLTPSDTKPQNAEDFSGFFMIGYNLSDRSFYVAIEITDNDYVSDTTKQVAWNTQDAVELYLDISHLAEGSGVASYTYSDTHKHINSNKWDAATTRARWENVEVKIKRNGIKRIYEWKFILGDVLQPGRSIGFDMNAFDKDADSFSWNAWGGGEMKYRNSTALGDVILMNENELPGTVTGQIKMSNATTEKLSAKLRFTSLASPQMWVTVLADSLGNYSTLLPKGTYSVALSDKFIPANKKVYAISTPSLANFSVKASNNLTVPTINATVSEAPDLIPAKGVLQTFNSQSPRTIDNFIETYQKYYKIPGISLA